MRRCRQWLFYFRFVCMNSLEQLLSDFRQARRDHDQMMKNAPRIIGVESVRIVKANFLIQGYDSGHGVEPWQARKAATNKAYDKGRTINAKTGKLSKYRTGKNANFKGSVFSSSKPLLRQTLNLYNSIQYTISGGYVFIGVNLSLVPYAKAHNLGLNHEPKRQFMPDTNQGINKKMIDAVNRKLKFETDNIMKRFKL